MSARSKVPDAIRMARALDATHPEVAAELRKLCATNRNNTKRIQNYRTRQQMMMAALQQAENAFQCYGDFHSITGDNQRAQKNYRLAEDMKQATKEKK